MRRSFDSRRSFDADVLQRSIRTGWADVKGIGISQYYHFFSAPRIWVCLTEEELLFFKDSVSEHDTRLFETCTPMLTPVNRLRADPFRPSSVAR